jgi:hypothetical protein
MADPVTDEWVTVEDDDWEDIPTEAPPAQRWAESQGVPPDLAQRFDREWGSGRDYETIGDAVSLLAAGPALKLAAGAGRLLTKIPVKPLVKAGVAGLMAGPRLSAAKRAFETAQAVAPKAAPRIPAAVKAAAGPKPKLSAQQVKQAMREQYGSEKGGRMLYGPARPGVTATQRQTLMKTGTQGGSLPKAAAQQHLGDLLRQIILERSGR